MSALGKVRYCLTSRRDRLLQIRVEFKSREYRRAIDKIILGIEALIDYADIAFDHKHAGAATTHWSAKPTPEDIEFWREAFEEWANSRSAKPEELRRRPDGNYEDDTTDICFGGWLAAMTTRARPRKQEAL